MLDPRRLDGVLLRGVVSTSTWPRTMAALVGTQMTADTQCLSGDKEDSEYVVMEQACCMLGETPRSNYTMAASGQ